MLRREEKLVCTVVVREEEGAGEGVTGGWEEGAEEGAGQEVPGQGEGGVKCDHLDSGGMSGRRRGGRGGQSGNMQGDW